MKKDSSWVEQMVHMKALGWDLENPMPRDRGSLAKWSRFENQNSTILVQELNPVGIIVHRDTAVAHYYYSVASENRQGERETIHGRYTDVLMKQDGKWQFIAWAGGEMSDDD
jgi:ketosteroid isomerase-like protein